MSTSRYASYNARNIYQHFTKQKALFLCIDALDLKSRDEPAPKMKLRLCEFDTTQDEHERMKTQIDVFLSAGEFLRLCHDVLNGVTSRKKRMAEGKANAGYFEKYGGTTKPQVISTKLTLVDGIGEDADFAFLATTGPGRVTSIGGIVPAAPGTPEAPDVPTTSVFVNMKNDDLKELCLIGQAYLQSFISMDLAERLAVVRGSRVQKK